MTNTILSKLLKIATEAESRHLDHISFKAGAAMRETRASEFRKRHAAKGDQIEIESWPDFLNWWNNNRGQNLTYIFIDTYGGNSEQVKMVKKLVNSAEKHERELHEFYMKLRDMASSKMDSDGGNGGSPDEEGLGSDMDNNPMEPQEDAGDDVSEEDALDEIAMGLDS